jgi:four helix bundle protein
MGVRRFEELVAWQRAHELSIAIYRSSARNAFGQDHDLRSQIRRAAVSVTSNVAEGFERYSKAEFRHFLSIARGSAAEVRTQLHLARSLEYLPDTEFQRLQNAAVEVSRLVAALRASIDPESPPPQPRKKAT